MLLFIVELVGDLTLSEWISATSTSITSDWGSSQYAG